MKIRNLLAACLTALASLGATSAIAAQKEVVVAGNIAENNASFGYLSFRHAVRGTITEGLSMRVDASRADFNFPNGAVQTNGKLDTVRALLSYGMLVNGASVKVFGGPSYVTKYFNPAAPGLTPIDSLGFFAGFEYSSWEDDDAGLQLIAEFETQQTTLYTRGTYLFAFGNVAVGPTAHFLAERGYERYGAGLWMNVNISDNATIFASAVAAEGGATAAARTSASYVELGLAFNF